MKTKKQNRVLETTPMNSEPFIRNLMCAVLLSAVEDYVGTTPECDKKVLPKYIFNKSTILKDLRSPRMVALSDGLSLTVADRLVSDPQGILNNLKKMVATNE